MQAMFVRASVDGNKNNVSLLWMRMRMDKQSENPNENEGSGGKGGKEPEKIDWIGYRLASIGK